MSDFIMQMRPWFGDEEKQALCEYMDEGGFITEFKRTGNFEQMLDQPESAMELWQELNPLTQNAFFSLMNQLDSLEQKGYFAFFQGVMKIADTVVVSFSGDDIQQLGDNIVLILETMKEMTQPEILTLLRSTVQAAKTEEDVETASLLGIIRQLNDPAVKRGLSRTLNVLKTVADN